MKFQKYCNMLTQIQRRMAFRIGSAYRTVSIEVAQVIAALVPLDLLIRERTATQKNDTDDRRNVCVHAMEEWQRKWTNLREKAEWTRRIIPDVVTWTGRRHGEASYQFTQFLSGHGCFRPYLQRFKRRESDICKYCGNSDTAHHVIYECAK